MAAVAQAPAPQEAPRAGRGRRPMTHRERDRLRLEISRAAVRLFREHGIVATSGERIAAEVGLSGRTLWRYFRTKESCVEPVLVRGLDGLVQTLRAWPVDRSLDEHLLEVPRVADPEADADGEAALAVIGMSRTDPALRAVWLVVHERAEATLAGLVAERAGRPPDDLTVRVRAAALAGALRITSEDLAVAFLDGDTPVDPAGRLTEAVRAANQGVDRGVDDARTHPSSPARTYPAGEQ